MPTRHTYEVFIVVHRGDPMDFQKYRHTGVWFVPVDGGSTYYFHVRGSTGAYEFDMGKDFDPTETKNFAKKIKVGTTRHRLASDDLVRRMEAVPVRNWDNEFNCHAWVDLAVKDMYEAHHLTQEEYEEGLDAMIDATLEAEDEGLA